MNINHRYKYAFEGRSGDHIFFVFNYKRQPLKEKKKKKKKERKKERTPAKTRLGVNFHLRRKSTLC